MKLDGRVVAITGAAGGIGRALATSFTRRGARVALLDRDAAGAEAAAAALREAGHEAIALACDVTSEEACRAAITRVRERLGGIDVLVNNAGISHLGRFAETDPAVLRRVMDVNFWGAVNCTKPALDALVERRGALVAISSVAGFAPLAGRVGYAASKHALQGLFSSLRAELRPLGVHVMLVCPSFVDTAIGTSALGPDGGRPRVARTTTGRAAAPEDVAETIVRGLERGRDLLVVGTVGWISWLLVRAWPSLYERLMARTLLRDEPGAR